jgi:outer membrane protein
MKRYIIFTSVAFLIGLSSLSAQQILDDYVQFGLENNRLIKDKTISYEQGLLALQEAKSLFLPSANLMGSYTLADGGRVIAIPIGDIINPAYAALNQLTGSQQFPMLDNVSEQFLPNNFYEAKVRVTYPLLNSGLRTNKTVKEQNSSINMLDLELYQLELTKDIKLAYYKWAMAINAVAVYESALSLVKRQLFTTQSLLANGKGLYAAVVRAESEVEQVNFQLIKAQNDVSLTKQYFNFLLNRPLESEIINAEMEMPQNLEVDIDNTSTLNNRLELMKLDGAIAINAAVLQSNKRYAIPKINSFLDLGSQAFDFQYNNQSRYAMAGLSLELPLYQGNRNRLKITQSENNAALLNNTKARVADQLNLTLQASQFQLETALKGYESAKKRNKAAAVYLNLITKGFEEGVNSLIEIIDARNQFTNSEINQNISFYQVLSAHADFERQTSIPNDNEK